MLKTTVSSASIIVPGQQPTYLKKVCTYREPLLHVLTFLIRNSGLNPA